jgi:hypothetical protein
MRHAVISMGDIMIYLPNWIYKPLPYAFMFLGAVVLTATELSTGRISGLLLILAGVLIFKLRDDRHKVSPFNRRQTASGFNKTPHPV